MTDIVKLKSKLKALGGDLRGMRTEEQVSKAIGKLEKREERIKVQETARLHEADYKPLEIIPVTRVINVLGMIEAPLPPKSTGFGGCSEEEIMQAIQPNIERGMTAAFSDNCWTFKRKGRMDSGTMCQPLKNIVICANTVCQESVPAEKLRLNSGLP